MYTCECITHKGQRGCQIPWSLSHCGFELPDTGAENHTQIPLQEQCTLGPRANSLAPSESSLRFPFDALILEHSSVIT